jgi:DNA-binding NtrC family response regulator
MLDISRKEQLNMVDTARIRGLIAENNLSQVKVAKAIGITPRTFYEKMKKGVFGSDELEVMIDILHIDDPNKVFFPKNLTS